MGKLIGLAGPATVGKSLIANMLRVRFQYTELAFADPLKKALMELTGLPAKYFYDQKLKHRYHPLIKMSPRKLMQQFGTEFVRDSVRKDFWVERMRVELESRPEHNKVVSDIRFDDEATLIRELGGVVIVLSRYGLGGQSDHTSEKGIEIFKQDKLIHLKEGK